MKKTFLLSLFLAGIVVFSACAPLDPVSPYETPSGSESQPQEVRETPAPPKEIQPSLPGGEVAPLEESEMFFETIRAGIAGQLGVDADQIRLVSMTTVEWPDGCLGLAAPDQMCIQVITPGYSLMIESGNRTFEVRTNLDGSQVRINTGTIAQPPVAEQPEIPAECFKNVDSNVYVDLVNAFCFNYPADMLQDERGLAAIYAQPINPANPEEATVRLDIFAAPAIPDAALDSLVGDFQKQFEGPDSPVKITRSAVELGGQPALMLEPVPGRLSSRMVFALHNGIFYQLIFFPLDVPQVKADFDRLYDAVISSFTFLP